jgi:rubredoxin
MAQSHECPKCGGAMTDGFIVDKTYGGADVPRWVEGEPKKSIWVGLKLGGTKPIEVTTWRCRRCGYLESYAPEE